MINNHSNSQASTRDYQVERKSLLHKIVHYRFRYVHQCGGKPLHQKPGQTGVGKGQTWPKNRGEPGLWPGFGWAGQGIKKTGEAAATGPA